MTERESGGTADLDPSVESQLLGWLDGTLTPDEEAHVAALLASRPDLARLVDEHRRVWDWMGEMELPGEAAPQAGFREGIVRRALGEESRRHTASRVRVTAFAAAAAVLAASLWWWMEDGPRWHRLSGEDRTIVHNLELLENLDVLREFGPELDLAVEMEVLRAFDGELPEDAR